jgi:hypothetical protein
MVTDAWRVPVRKCVMSSRQHSQTGVDTDADVASPLPDGVEPAQASHARADASPLRISRRRAMACLAWAGAGILWTLDGGVPRGLSLGGAVHAADKATRGALSFVQISDSHIGFNKAPNPDPAATLQSAIDRIRAAPQRPAFMLHTCDVSHLSLHNTTVRPVARFCALSSLSSSSSPRQAARSRSVCR